MFIVYDVNTKCVQNQLLLNFISMKIKNGVAVQLSAPYMPELVLDMGQMKNFEQTECFISYAKKFLVKSFFVDCGDEAAFWISGYA